MKFHSFFLKREGTNIPLLEERGKGEVVH